ncbi:MAG: transporter [Coriobacteriia bacterium]|nr:transporter [Coriobacteriia bacterium]
MRGLNRQLTRKILAVLAIAVLLAALLVPTLALARAGGGHVGGSSGGSRSSGGSSSRSSGGSSLGGGVPIILGSGGGGGLGCCSLPVIIIVVIVIVLVVISNNKKNGGGGGAPMTFDPNASGTYQPVEPQMPAGDPFAEIKAADPAFSEQIFYGRVNEMFIAIQYAWMNRNMEPVRRFLADQQFSVLNNGVQEYVLNGTINMLQNVHITEMHPVAVTKEGDFDSVKMLVTAACIDYTINERTKEIVNPAELGDGKTPTTFQEYWTFMRKSGAVSKVDSSIQKCPNCGAPVTDGNYVKCAYCSMQMNDPTLDWVLMRIEQV